MTDPLDQPGEDAGYALVYPFVVCRSQGGPYEDAPFVAGVQFGQIDRALEVIAAAGGDRLSVTVYTALVPQIELAAMARGFPTVVAEQVEETADHPAMPEWSHVTITSGTG